MAKSLKQLQLDEKRKGVKIKKLEAELKKEKLAIAQILKAIPAQRKKEVDSKKGGKKRPVKKVKK